MFAWNYQNISLAILSKMCEYLERGVILKYAMWTRCFLSMLDINNDTTKESQTSWK